MSFLSGLWFLSFFIGPVIGAGIADLMSRSVRKRGRSMAILAGACMVVGVFLVGMLFTRNPAGGFLFFLNIGILLYLFLGVGAAVARLR
jgi:hypothetical protein